MPRFQTCTTLYLLLHSFMLVGISSGKSTRLWTPLEDIIIAGGTIDAVTDPKSSMLADGYNLVSSELSNGVTFELWSQTQTSTPSKRSISDLLSSTPEKRSTTIDIQGGQCNTSCAFQTNVPKVNTADCAPAYTELYNKTGVFTLPPTQALSATFNTCSVWVVNHSTNNITYDYWDAGGTGQWLNWNCLMEQDATVGVCQYKGIGTNTTNGVWTAVCAPSFMTGN